MANIGIIGTGWGSRVQVPIFKRAGLDVVAISGHDATKTGDIARSFGIEARDWKAIVEDVSIDVVSIVTPPALHLEMTLAALEAGKHVLCEKPTAMNAHEAETMLRAAEARPTQIALIDHELRFLPAWKAARKSVGRIGHVRYVEARFSSPSRGDRKRQWNWWSDARQGGGVWGAVGSHFVDAVRYLVGEIEQAQAVERTFIAERPHGEATRVVTSDDFTAVHLQLANGAIAVMTLAVVSAVDEPSVITIHGEDGGLRLESDKWWMAERGGSWQLQPFDAGDLPDNAGDLPGNSPGGFFGSGTWYLAKALRGALDDGDRDALGPAATFVDGWKQQRALDAARASAADDGSWKRV